MACEHILSLFYDFYQQQILQGSLLHNEEPEQDDLSQCAQSPRFGIIMRSPQDLLCKRRATSFNELNFKLTSGQEINLTDSPVRPFLGVININLVAAADETGKTIIKNNHPLYYVSLSLLMHDQVLKKINLLGHDLIFDWDSGQTFSAPQEWLKYFKILSTTHLLQSLDDHVTMLHFFSPAHNFVVDDITYDFKNFVTPTLNINVTEGKIRQTYFITVGANHNDQNVPTPIVLSLFADKNNPFSTPGHFFDSSTYAASLLKWKFPHEALQQSEDGTVNLSLEREQFFNTWLDGADDVASRLINECKEKSRLELWNEAITLKENLYTCDPANKTLLKWSSRELMYLMAKLFNHFGAHLFKKSEWVHHNNQIHFEINHHNLFKNIGDLYRDFQALGISLYWQQKPLYQWKTNSRIQRVRHDLDWFDLRIDIAPEDLKILQQIQNSQTVQWLDGKMILLSDEQKIFSQLIKRYLPHQIEVTEEQQISIKLHRCRIFELFHLKKIGFDHLLTPEEEQLCLSLLNLKSIPAYPIAERYSNVLRPYQIDGYRWLQFLYDHQLGGCLADDMGLGKTIQTISLIQTIKDKIKKVLIVCPVSILWNWQEELARFSDLKIKLYYGDQRTIADDDLIILTSYGLLKRDFESTFKNMSFDLLVLDEVQQLKNYQSLGSQISKRINARVRFVLTGTPVENDISEFYNVLDLCVPGIWGEQKWHRKGADEAKSFAKVLSRPFVLRRTKAQVLRELPEKTEQVVYLHFSSEEERNYQHHLNQIKQAMMDMNQKQGVGQVLKNLLQMRQLCLWQSINHIEHSTKMNFLFDSVSQLLQEQHSIIIFSQFTSYLDKIQKRLLVLNVGISRIDGSQPLKSRQEHVQKFQAGINPIFLISLRAGGFGLNLTKASYLFLMDPWWNPAVENQAIDRAHRIGQNKHLTVYRPIIKESVEEKVLTLQQEKKKLFDELVNSESGDHFSGKLTLDDFKFLLS